MPDPSTNFRKQFIFYLNTDERSLKTGFSRIIINPHKRQLYWEYFYPRKYLSKDFPGGIGTLAHIGVLDDFKKNYSDADQWSINHSVYSLSSFLHMRRMQLNAGNILLFLICGVFGNSEEFPQYYHKSKTYHNLLFD